MARQGLIVVKMGSGVAPAGLLDEVASIVGRGEEIVLVHGGGLEIDRLCARLGITPRVIHSPDGTRSRRTDAEVLEAVTMALVGSLKPRLVAGLRARGVAAAGLAGADAGIVTAERRPAIRDIDRGRMRLIRDDRSGRITVIDPRPLQALLGAGVVPVVSPPAAGEGDELLNVDADQMAARLAMALGARALVLLTNVPGVLSDPADRGSVIPELSADHPAITGRMRHKVRAATNARNVVERVVIASALVPDPIASALGGTGTVVTTGERASA